MVDRKIIRFVGYGGTLITLFILSLIIGEMTFGKDVRFCQMIAYCNMFVGVIAFYLLELFDKKFPFIK